METPKHTESAGGIVLNSRGKIAVVNQNGRSWSLPKGHIEPGEDALAAARREIYEETGLQDIEFLRPLGDYERNKIGLETEDDPSERKRIFMFLFRAKSENLSPLDPENPEARWCTKEEVLALLTHAKDREFFADAAQEF